MLKIHHDELLFPEKSTLIVEEEERPTKAEYALEKCNNPPAWELVHINAKGIRQ